MVASHRRGEACRVYLRASGLTEKQIARLKVPAGLDIGAVTPEEIAASILAELVQVRRELKSKENGSAIPQEEQEQLEDNLSAAATATDLVCGMIVEIANARHRSNYEGHAFYFCCPACKRLFEDNPQQYLMQHER
jgi:xanthine dehydrogenase accessory factor